MDTLVTQIAEAFKTKYGLKVTDGADLLVVERKLMEFMMLRGRGVMGEMSALSNMRRELSLAEAFYPALQPLFERISRPCAPSGIHPADLLLSFSSETTRIRITPFVTRIVW